MGMITLTAGAVGSLSLFLLACYRNHSPVILVFLIGIWVLAPFVALFLARFAVARRAPGIMARWNVITAVVLSGSLAVYAVDAVSPLASKAAAVFVVTPVAGWVVMAIAAVLSLRAR